MRMKTGAMVLAGVLFGAAALVPAISEGRGGGGTRCNPSQCRQLNQDCPQDGQRLRDGSCGNPSCPQTGQGATRGCRNGGGAGSQGAGPQDGTGSGSPSKQ